MLDVVDGPRRRGHRSRPLQRMVDEFDLTESQLHLWRSFEDVFEEVRHAVEATEAIADHSSRHRPPSLAESLETQAQLLAVRLGATRRLQTAATVLLAGLTPRQRASAERHLAVLCRRSGGGIGLVA